MSEAEQKALADQALADFAANEGIRLEPETPAAGEETPEVQKTMGPEEAEGEKQ